MGKICIRVDGNEIIATGHVMRCLSIARQLKKLGQDIVFVLADSRPVSMIEENGFNSIVLGTVWDDMDTEIEEFCRYLSYSNTNTVLLDSYFVTEEYLSRISMHVNVCYIDDLDTFVYPVNTLINYSLQCDRDYESRYRTRGYDTKFLLGCKYIPLREEFFYIPYEVKDKVRRVLITTGGTDQLNIAYKLLEQLMLDAILGDLEYHVIVGRFNENKEKLSRLAMDNSNIILHENVTNMSYWMRVCDVAITAAGTTTFELAACGIPSICFEVADNQVGAKLWETGGYMFYAGNAYLNQGECLEECQTKLQKLCENLDARKAMSKNMQKLVDGKGAFRIASYLIKLSKEN